jgi:Fe-S-cluster containining protein
MLPKTLIGLTSAHAESVVENASRMFHGELDFVQQPDFPEAVNRRLPVSRQMAQDNLQKASRPLLSTSMRLLYRSHEASSKAKKYAWLAKAADQFSTAMQPAAACQAGCTSCCHIPVSITRFEAGRIAAATGHPMNPSPSAAPVEASHKSPCPFLKQDLCSIYEHRPIACRTHLNLDTDPLLCQLVEGAMVPVPYADSRPFSLANIEISDCDINDIRNWFEATSDSKARIKQVHNEV